MPSGGRREPSLGKRLGRPPKLAHSLTDIDKPGVLESFLGDIKQQALGVIEGMARPQRLQAVVDAIYKAAVGVKESIKQQVTCPHCQKGFEAVFEYQAVGNVKAQQLWLERVAGRVPQTMILRDPAREGYIQMLREIRERAGESRPVEAIEGEFRVDNALPAGVQVVVTDSPSCPQETEATAE